MKYVFRKICSVIKELNKYWKDDLKLNKHYSSLTISDFRWLDPDYRFEKKLLRLNWLNFGFIFKFLRLSNNNNLLSKHIIKFTQSITLF